MENDAVFAIEADVDAAFRSGNSSNSSTRHHAEENTRRRAKAGIGGSEESSLLDDEESGYSEDEGYHGPSWSGMTEFEGLPWWKKPSIFWVLPPFLLSTLAFGGIVVPKLNLILTLICQEYIADRSTKDPNFTIMPIVFGEDNPQCQVPGVQSRVAQFTLYGNLISGILSAITSPKLGALSDRYGRKKLLIVSTLGLLFGEITTIFAAKYPETFSINWILVGYALDGLCGSFIVAMALAHSYATDCTSPQKRNVAFGYFHGCLFTGIALGPLIAGYIIKATHSVLSVFYIALGAHLLFMIFLASCIPESLSKSRQAAAREKHKLEIERLGPAADWINQIRSFNLLEPLKILYPTGEGSSNAVRRNLVLLACVDTIVFSVAMGALTVVIIYTNIQFSWGNLESSRFVSVVSSCRVFCLMIVLPIITRLVRGREGTSRQRNTGSDNFELSIIRIAVFFDMVGYLGYTLARSGPLFILSGCLASVGGIGSPTLGSALTKHVPADRTGQLLGATGLLHALARIIGPTIFNAIYSATVGKFRQTVFVCLTATFGLAFICSWFVRPHVYLDEPDVLWASVPANETAGEESTIQ
ncbi:MFS general substrate transporter [Lepidopterella palustris CBS 459.81]|uniref:MFS general substrate transporter n=1 Tax=Lepidopterella palustris CBS 459.81 TaxID=1314670 RepID=A0A8E2J8Z9_9PEZI|nr:MFS general substrate transporter [Lepidopterella palustris CBS 459.81]